MTVFLPMAFYVHKANMSNGALIHPPGPKSAYGFVEAMFYRIWGLEGLQRIKAIYYAAYDIDPLGSEVEGLFSMERVFSRDEKTRKALPDEFLDIIHQVENQYEGAPLFKKWTPWVQNMNALDMPTKAKKEALPASPTLRQLAVCDMHVAIVIAAEIEDLHFLRETLQTLLDKSLLRFAGGTLHHKPGVLAPPQLRFEDAQGNPLLSFLDAVKTLPTRAQKSWWVCDAAQEVEAIAQENALSLDEAAMLLGAGMFPQEGVHYGLNLIGYHTIEDTTPVIRHTPRGEHPHLFVEPVYGAVRYQKLNDCDAQGETFAWHVHREDGFFYVSNALNPPK